MGQSQLCEPPPVCVFKSSIAIAIGMFGFVRVLLNKCSGVKSLFSLRFTPDNLPASLRTFDFCFKFVRSFSCLLFTTFDGSFLCGVKNFSMIFSAASTVHPRPTHPANSTGSAGMPSPSQDWSKALRYQSSSRSDSVATRPDERMSFGYQR